MENASFRDRTGRHIHAILLFYMLAGARFLLQRYLNDSLRFNLSRTRDCARIIFDGREAKESKYIPKPRGLFVIL